VGDLKWLSSYSGQSTDELIALESEYRTDSLVVAFEQALDQKAVRTGVGSLTREELVILAVEAFEREVGNGGYSQFFLNSSNEYVSIIVAALMRIGCSETATLTKRAMDIVGIGPAQVTRNYSDTTTELAPERMEELSRCDIEYVAVAGDLASPLFQFIKSERKRITLS
jgi:hypothetical protein